MLITVSPVLMNAMDRALAILTTDCGSMLDVGCGRGAHTKLLTHILKRLHIDIVDYGGEHALQSFQQMGAQDIREHFNRHEFDVVIGLDFIEHLNDADARKFLQDVELIALQRIIIFTPEGDKLIGYDNHLSGWTAKQFEEEFGYQVWLCPDFHLSLGAGAFLAWKTLKGNEITPEQLAGKCGIYD